MDKSILCDFERKIIYMVTDLVIEDDGCRFKE